MSWWIDSFAEGYKSIFDGKFIPIISNFSSKSVPLWVTEWNEMSYYTYNFILGELSLFFHSSQFRRIFHHVHHPGVTKNGPLTGIIIFDEKEPIFHRAFYVLFSPDLRSMCVCVCVMNGKILTQVFVFPSKRERLFFHHFFSTIFS